jgi:hypothetical protein
MKPTWDEVDRRIEFWSRPGEGVLIEREPDSTMPIKRRVGPVRLAPGDRGAELARGGLPNDRPVTVESRRPTRPSCDIE